MSVRQSLEEGARELQCPLGAGQLDRLESFSALLLKWNKVYNLTAVRNEQDVVRLHLLDCLAAAGPLARREAGAEAAQILDVGSGGGLPGVVLAILFPRRRVDCIDAVAKKAAFVRQAASELNLPNLHALHGRVEAHRGQYELITSRAFAALADFCNWTQHLLAPTGVWMAMKGKPPTDELTHLPESVRMFHVEQLHVPGVDAERCLVWLRKANGELGAPA